MVAIVMSSDVTSSPEMLKNSICYNNLTAVVTKNRIRQNGGSCDVTRCDVTDRFCDVPGRNLDCG